MSGLEFRCFVVFTHAAVEAGWWKNYTISHFLLKEKQSTKNSSCFSPAIHPLARIKSFKSSFNFLKNWMKNFLQEPWFLLKTNTSLSFTQQRKGKAGGCSHFVLPTASWEDHGEDTHRPNLCFAPPSPSWKQRPPGVMVRLNCTTQPSASGGNSLTTKGRESLSCDSTGL